MHCMFNFEGRPPTGAKVSRKLWDDLTTSHGEAPKSLGLYVSEGGFRDWMFIISEDLLEIEAGLIGNTETSLKSTTKAWAQYSVEDRQRRNA